MKKVKKTSKSKPKLKAKSFKKNASRPKSKSVSKISFGLKPLSDRVIILESKGSIENKTDSGIYIPASAKEDRGSKRGKVVAVGRGKVEDGKLTPVSVSVGDTVLYSWGEAVVFEGIEYTVVRDGDISAIIS